jgi:hypothetical protein
MQRLKNELNLTASIVMIYMVKKEEKISWEWNTGRPHHKQARYHFFYTYHFFLFLFLSSTHLDYNLLPFYILHNFKLVNPCHFGTLSHTITVR